LKERIQKLLSEAGICSRRSAEKLILAKRVKVNGLIAQLGDSADILKDKITVDDNEVYFQNKNIYIMLNKPRGYVTTLSDEAGRNCITQLISDIKDRIYPIGRLDMHSEGLLLLTNDGELANKLTHPKHEVYKKYLVKVTYDNGVPDISPEISLSKSIEIDGFKLLPAKCRLVEKLDDNKYILTISIREGKNRQIRRMCVACGYTVNSLKRIAVGNLVLGDLPAGAWRNLTEDEINYLKSL
jgi:23S rRNA pseudouridine2605 synthase